MPALEELEDAWREADTSGDFHMELDSLLASFVGRPTPLTDARRLTAEMGEPGFY